MIININNMKDSEFQLFPVHTERMIALGNITTSHNTAIIDFTKAIKFIETDENRLELKCKKELKNK